MGLLDKLRGELIDIVEWLDDERDVMVHRFSRYQNEIKMGAKLVVRESQSAVFVNEGKVADVFGPGTYSLSTRNLPLLSTLRGWRFGFDSPFKAEVYFVNTRRFVDLKWGTANPVMLRDPEFGPVRLRACGTYCVKVSNPQTFLRETVSTDPTFETAEISGQLRNTIVARFSDLLAEAKIPVLELAANYDELGSFASQRLHDEFQEYGLDLEQFLVESISLPAAVERALDKRSEMGVVGDLGRFTQYQAAVSMEQAASQPTGGGAEGLGLGMGVAVRQRMADALGGGGASTATCAAPPPLPTVAPSYYLGVAGRQLGPFPLDGLRSEIESGRLIPGTLVWTQWQTAWTPASTVPAVAALFSPEGGPAPAARVKGDPSQGA